MKIDGGCHCGHIKYEANVNPDSAILCHCIDCQILSGGAFRTALPTPESDFTLISGEPKTYIKIAESGAKRAQVFCPECGTHIYATSVGEGPKIINLRFATARQRDEIRPQKQVWFRSKQDWILDLSSISQIPKR